LPRALLPLARVLWVLLPLARVLWVLWVLLPRALLPRVG
jgi:hypothetical protein